MNCPNPNQLYELITICATFAIMFICAAYVMTTEDRATIAKAQRDAAELELESLEIERELIAEQKNKPNRKEKLS